MMALYIKGVNLPKKGECDVYLVEGDGSVRKWFNTTDEIVGSSGVIGHAEEVAEKKERE